MKIREEISGIKVGAQKDLEKFVEDTIRQLPNVIESAKQDDLRKFLPSFLEDTFRQWAEGESKDIAAKLEVLAEKTIALIKEDAHDATKRVGEALGHDVKKLDIQIDTFRYDRGHRRRPRARPRHDVRQRDGRRSLLTNRGADHGPRPP